MARFTLGVDVGGTFTDFHAVSAADGTRWRHKLPSTPDNPADAILAGLDVLLGEDGPGAEAVAWLEHGTTVATNALLQGRGATLALITTAGFRDLLEIGRQVRPHMYDLQKDPPRPLVPRHRRFELAERVSSEGRILNSPSEAEIDEIIDRVVASGAEAVAVCFLFAFLNPENEARVRDRLAERAPDLFVSLSHEVHPEFREFERFSTTVLNAYLQPVMARYLDSLEDRLAAAAPGAPLDVNQSSGGLMSVTRARRFPVRTALSGPAAGVVGAVEVARGAGRENIITLDMGGTSADVCLVQGGQAQLAFDREVAEFPVRLAMLDINTIGAGGGSILWFDADGLAKVGPESAGADPGPACYGRGGTAATVSDANLLLGRLPAGGLLGGRMPLDVALARAAFAPVAEHLGYSVERAAHGVIEIAVANMVRAIRAISVERGHDPREFSLMAFGGAGPLHASDVARALAITEIIVPAAPGILCAAGLLASDLKEDFVATARIRLEPGAEDALARTFEGLHEAARAWFRAEDVAPDARRVDAALDMRHVGQNFELRIDLGDQSTTEGVSLPDTAALAELFLRAHETQYGYRSADDAIEIVNFRLTARGRPPRAPDPVAPPHPETSAPATYRPVYFEAEAAVDTPVHGRDRLAPGQRLDGPAVIEQLDTTTVLFPGDRLRVDEASNLIIEVAPL